MKPSTTRAPQTPFAEVVCELLKLLRTQWMSIKQIAAAVPLRESTAAKWVKVLYDHGLLRRANGVRSIERRGAGPVARIYSVAPEWGGTA